jgi:hypothetical protein
MSLYYPVRWRESFFPPPLDGATLLPLMAFLVDDGIRASSSAPQVIRAASPLRPACADPHGASIRLRPARGSEASRRPGEPRREWLSSSRCSVRCSTGTGGGYDEPRRDLLLLFDLLLLINLPMFLRDPRQSGGNHCDSLLSPDRLLLGMTIGTVRLSRGALLPHLC